MRVRAQRSSTSAVFARAVSRVSARRLATGSPSPTRDSASESFVGGRLRLSEKDGRGYLFPGLFGLEPHDVGVEVGPPDLRTPELDVALEIELGSVVRLVSRPGPARVVRILGEPGRRWSRKDPAVDGTVRTVMAAEPAAQ